MKSVVVLLLFVTIVSTTVSEVEDDLGYHPMQNPDMFGGDMLGVDVTDRNIIPHPNARWPGKTIPYEFDHFTAKYSFIIQNAMEEYHNRTCVRFVKRTNETNYIKIFGGKGCYSAVGMVGGQQPVSLGRGCMNKGTIVHELGHALGFYHEQNRSDRRKYLIIHWDNIQDGMARQFMRLKPDQNLLWNKFDYKSIMIYGNTAFSRNGHSKTMEAITGVKLTNPSEKDGLTKSDVYRIKKMYDC